MKALVFDKKLQYIDNYPEPGRKDEKEVLVEVKIAGICNTDIEITKGFMGFKGVLGHEFVGIIRDSINPRSWGRRVAGEINCTCGRCRYCSMGRKNHCINRSVLGILNRDGAFAEYLTLPEENLYYLPDSIDDEEGVFIEPLAAAFRITEQIKFKPGDKIVLLGDGKLGLLIANVLYRKGCNILVIGKHPKKLAVLQKFSIRGELVDDIKEKVGVADVVIEATGSPEGIKMAMQLVKPEGKILLKSTISRYNDIDISSLVINEVTIIGSRCGSFKRAIDALRKKEIDVKPLISSVYPIEEGIEAFKEAVSNRDSIKVMIRMKSS
ncbi:MAG: alcohol dehydrogenase catalytic domain-containing protein [Nitrospirota bacterium]